MKGDLVCAVDVGTTSARAGLFDGNGEHLASAEHPILMNRSRADHAEHDSEDIWRAVCHAVDGARRKADVDPVRVAGIAFDATCSLVVRAGDGGQVSVSLDGDERWDTIVWLDHRALDEADECTDTGHRVLDFVGGVMSPEMQTPKLMWLKRNLPKSWNKAVHFFDLADFLAWKAGGSTARSRCTLTSKWTYLAHEDGWQRDFFAGLGVGDLIERGGLPERAVPVGHPVGCLGEEAARELGLHEGCIVGAGTIDAFAGALGVLAGEAGADIERHVALIAGTSSCLMGFSHEERHVPGVWGPYFGATLPGVWLSEGGQSVSGGLLDHVIRWHGAGGAPDHAMHQRITHRIADLRREEGYDLAGRLHVLPDFHGNRSPLADPHAVGVISGLTLDAGFDSLCRLYWRTAVAIALGVRHIVEAFNAHGHAIETLHITGGHTRNPLLMELYASAVGCTVIEPQTDNAMLLGSAMVAATAAGLHPSLPEACRAMARPALTLHGDPAAKARFDRDYQIFLEMHRQRAALDAIV